MSSKTGTQHMKFVKPNHNPKTKISFSMKTITKKHKIGRQTKFNIIFCAIPFVMINKDSELYYICIHQGMQTYKNQIGKLTFEIRSYIFVSRTESNSSDEEACGHHQERVDVSE